MADNAEVSENEENISNFSSYTSTRRDDIVCGDHGNSVVVKTLINVENEKKKDWLKQKGLQIKVMPHQESLFRAISEELCLSQANWERLKNQLLKYLTDRRPIFERRVRLSYAKEMNVKPFGQLERDVHEFGRVCGKEQVSPWYSYMYRLANGTNVAGVIEIGAISSLYKCNIAVYRAISSAPLIFGKYATDESRNVINVKLLNLRGSTHYDLLVPASSVNSAAICQSVVYEMLYEKVFGLHNTLAASAVALGKQPSSKLLDGRKRSSSSKIDADEPDALKHMRNEYLPFPLKIAKSIDSSTYRDANLDSPARK